jgi:AcrR family transcriptional regulator
LTIRDRPVNLANGRYALSEAVTSARRDAKRDTIIEVARQVFFEEGYAAASMSTIAARLGGSKGTLYNYFKSKEELFEA